MEPQTIKLFIKTIVLVSTANTEQKNEWIKCPFMRFGETLIHQIKKTRIINNINYCNMFKVFENKQNIYLSNARYHELCKNSKDKQSPDLIIIWNTKNTFKQTNNTTEKTKNTTTKKKNTIRKTQTTLRRQRTQQKRQRLQLKRQRIH